MSETAMKHEREPMSDAAYAVAQKAALFMAMTAAGHDFDAMLERIGTTHALAPIIDPTRYMAGARNLELIERLARAASQFRVTALDVLEALEFDGKASSKKSVEVVER